MGARSLFLALFFTGLALTTLAGQDDHQGPQLQGKMETSDGSMCVWFELRKSGRGNVFVTACHCKNAQGHRQSYSCEFDGAMQECQEYQKSPKDFYSMIATSLQSMLSGFRRFYPGGGGEASSLSHTVADPGGS
jgi:hypothetical protein